MFAGVGFTRNFLSRRENRRKQSGCVWLGHASSGGEEDIKEKRVGGRCQA